MKLKSLRVYNFRNQKEKTLLLEGNNAIFLGKIGSGKTSLLEAISFFSTGKSFKTNQEKELIKKGEEESKIEILVEKDNGEEIKEEWYFKNKESFYLINKEKFKKRKNILGLNFFIVSSLEDKIIINGEPEKRRNYIDTLIYKRKNSYYTTLLKYRKCIKNRNVLLKEKRIKEIEAWDKIIVSLGDEITKEREKEIKKRNKEAKEIFSFLEGKSEIEIKYKPNIKKTEDFFEELKNNIEKDIEYQSTTVGPHKDEVEILINNLPAKNYASQGQKKLICLALALSEKKEEERKKEKAIFLLDDIFSELDEEKRKKILEFSKDNQTIITSAEELDIKNFNKIFL